MIWPNDFDDALRLFLDSLAATSDPDERLDLITNAVLETGGSFLVPKPGDNWGPHVIEISLYGICQQGETVDSAVANWTDCATRAVKGQSAARRADALISGDLSGIPADDLRDAAACVRLYSADPAALARADHVFTTLSTRPTL